MVMWCPDDTCRESWVWVGQLTGERESMIQLSSVEWKLLAEENGSSPDSIVFVFDAIFRNNVCQQSSGMNW